MCSCTPRGLGLQLVGYRDLKCRSIRRTPPETPLPRSLETEPDSEKPSPRSNTMADNLLASVRYVVKDPTTPPNEKGYILHYAAPPGFPQNNFKIEPHKNIKMHDLRNSPLSYGENGIKVARINSEGMKPELFDDDEWIESVYLPELHRSLCATLGAKDVTIFDWMLRKRAVSFPQRNVGEKNEEQAQPSLSAHIGG